MKQPLFFSYTMLSVLCVTLTTSVALADDISVAVASNFAEPMQEIAAAFDKKTGHKTQLSPASTGKLYAQIKNGAPFDIFLSADDTTPTLLEQEGHAVIDSHFTYATGKLVLWSAKNHFVDSEGAVLKTPTFAHLAIANPATAPYGAAAVAVMKKMNVLNTLQPKWVQGDNITQTFQFVSSGNAELGFVALSQVYKDGKITSGSAWIVTPALYEPLHQDAVLLNKGNEKPAAKALLNFLKTDEAKQIIRRYGYDS